MTEVWDKLNELTAEIETHGAPSNEANTVNQTILPILHCLGYKPFEIHAETTDVSGQRPDLTIHAGEQRWFLEAKAWNLTLDLKHASQAVTYAYQKGSRWAVLTNGRVWNLYDAHLVGVPIEGRLIVSAGYDQPDELVELLVSLSKTNFPIGGPARLAGRKRALKEIRQSLQSGTLAKVLKAITTPLELPPEDGIELLRSALDLNHPPANAPIEKKLEKTDQVVAPVDPGGKQVPPLSRTLVTPGVVTHKKPTSVRIAGQDTEVKSWKSLAVTVLGWAFTHGAPPPEWRIGSKAKSPFWIVGSPVPGMLAPVAVGSGVFDSHYSASDLLTHSRAFVEVCGLDPAQVSFEVRA